MHYYVAVAYRIIAQLLWQILSAFQVVREDDNGTFPSQQRVEHESRARRVLFKIIANQARDKSF